mmetsp:Transcript_14498/g.38301  ORF Transcript_14498/g.38301 Transcript_14498/m.38301 type:complete len:313 (-) Transcript_14498:92-1030(-)
MPTRPNPRRQKQICCRCRGGADGEPTALRRLLARGQRGRRRRRRRAELAKLEAHSRGEEAAAADQVAEGDDDEVLRDDLRDRHLRARQLAEGQEEDVGDRVLEADCDKHRDARPDAEDLAGHVGGGGGEEDGERDEPVAQHRLDQVGQRRARALLRRERRRDGGRAALEEPGFLDQVGDRQAAGGVAERGDAEGAEHLLDADLALQPRRGAQHEVARHQLPGRLQDEDEADREDEADHEALQVGAGVRQHAGDGEREDAADRHVHAAHERLVQRLGQRRLRVDGALLGERLVGLGGQLGGRDGLDGSAAQAG